MYDSYGRNIDYLRISVTERCNLRCSYCMPLGLKNKVNHKDILSYDEIAFLVGIFSEIGIKKIKITGGEPLVRENLSDLVKVIKDTGGIEQVTLTTNGVMLKDHIEKLATAGIDGINISLDTLDRKKYEQITGSDCLGKVLEAVELWQEYPDIRFKINVVPLRSLTDDELCLMAGLAENRNIDVRFIELMPIGMGKENIGFMQDEILSILENLYGRAMHDGNICGAGPAKYYRFKKFAGQIGFISAMSHSFCSSCNRVRLTSEGFLKPCLSYGSGMDLRKMLRAGIDRETILNAVKRTIYFKPACHGFGKETSEELEQKYMSDIGG